jgi:hypothetical protein
MAPGKRAAAIAILTAAVVVQLAVFLYQLERTAERSAPFSIEISPGQVVEGAVGLDSIFAVSIREEGEGDHRGEAVNLSAMAPGATLNLSKASVMPDECCSLIVTPGEALAGRNLTVTVLGRRGRKEKTTATIIVAQS